MTFQAAEVLLVSEQVAPQVHIIQIGQRQERRNVGEDIGIKIEGVQLRQIGEERDGADQIVAEFEGVQIGQASEEQKVLRVGDSAQLEIGEIGKGSEGGKVGESVGVHVEVPKIGEGQNRGDAGDAGVAVDPQLLEVGQNGDAGNVGKIITAEAEVLERMQIRHNRRVGQRECCRRPGAR